MKSRKRRGKHCRKEPIRREEELDDIGINTKQRKRVEKHIKVLEQQQADGQTQANNLINGDSIRLNLLGQIQPFITESQNLIKHLPKGLIKQTYPNWNNNQEIHFWWSGNINEGTDVSNFISHADHPYLPTSFLKIKIQSNNLNH